SCIWEKVMTIAETVTTALCDDRVLTAALQRVKTEYLEMPGLQLTRNQAARLWSYDLAFCDAVLSALVAARFLTCTRGASFVRAADTTAVVENWRHASRQGPPAGSRGYRGRDRSENRLHPSLQSRKRKNGSGDASSRTWRARSFPTPGPILNPWPLPPRQS